MTKQERIDEYNKLKNLETIKRNIVEIIPEEELIKKIRSGKPLRVKLGIDPTSPDIHIGNAVVLRKLRDFQELGHTAVLIIGDFTAKIGDPSGHSVARPQLKDSEIAENMQNYKLQIFKLLMGERTEIRYNSEWLAGLSSEEIIKLASKFTVAQVIERDDISRRYKNKEPIALHELLYAIFQGYDSVVVESDIELGATEQKFNLLFGRELQRAFKQPPQIAMTMPILEGLDGVKKMSKSYNNYVGITESPKEMFGKIMSIPDSSILNYFKLATELSLDEISNIEKELKEKDTNPMEYKQKLAKTIVSMYHSEDLAESAEKEFLKIFREKSTPENIPSYILKEKKIWIVKLLVDSELVSSKSEARRLIQQGGVSIDKVTLNDSELEIEIKEGFILRAGKRNFLKVSN